MGNNTRPLIRRASNRPIESTCRGLIVSFSLSESSRIRLRRWLWCSWQRILLTPCCKPSHAIRGLSSTYSSFAVACNSHIMLFCEIGTLSVANVLFNHSWTVQPSPSESAISMQSENNRSIEILTSACRLLAHATKIEMGDL
jgi:hypothetical protein